MNEPNIVILAGGLSSRMKQSIQGKSELDPNLAKAALEQPKAMLGVGEGSRPFLDYLLASVEKSGYSEVVIVVGEQDQSIKEYYTKHGNTQFPFLNISYVTQCIPAGRIKPLGTADALLMALQLKPEWRSLSFTVCNSDNLYSVNALRALLECKHPNALIDYDRTALQFPPERIAHFAVIKKDTNAFLTDIIEKPTIAEIHQAADTSGRIGVSMNLFRLSYDMIFPVLESTPLHPVRNEKELPVAVKMMNMLHPKSTLAIPFAEHVIDLTNQADIPVVSEYLKNLY